MLSCYLCASERVSECGGNSQKMICKMYLAAYKSWHFYFSSLSLSLAAMPSFIERWYETISQMKAAWERSLLLFTFKYWIFAAPLDDHSVILFFALLKISEMSLRVSEMVNTLHTKIIWKKRDKDLRQIINWQ